MAPETCPSLWMEREWVRCKEDGSGGERGRRLGIDPYNEKALDYDSRGLWLNGVAVESGERRERTMDDLAAIASAAPRSTATRGRGAIER